MQCILRVNEMKYFATCFLSIITLGYDFSDKSRVFKMLPRLDSIFFLLKQLLHWFECNDKSDNSQMLKNIISVLLVLMQKFHRVLCGLSITKMIWMRLSKISTFCFITFTKFLYYVSLYKRAAVGT